MVGKCVLPYLHVQVALNFIQFDDISVGDVTKMQASVQTTPTNTTTTAHGHGDCSAIKTPRDHSVHDVTTSAVHTDSDTAQAGGDAETVACVSRRIELPATGGEASGASWSYCPISCYHVSLESLIVLNGIHP